MKNMSSFLAVIAMLLLLVGCSSTNNSIVDAKIDDSGHLMITLTDGTVIDAGKARGEDGKDGKDGIDGKDGVNGTNGIDGIDGADGKDGVNGSNGTNGTVMEVGENGDWLINGKDSGIKAGYMNPRITGIVFDRPYVFLSSSYGEIDRDVYGNRIIRSSYVFDNRGGVEWLSASYALNEETEWPSDTFVEHGVPKSIIYEGETYYCCGFEGCEMNYELTDEYIIITTDVMTSKRCRLMQDNTIVVGEQVFALE